MGIGDRSRRKPTCDIPINCHIADEACIGTDPEASEEHLELPPSKQQGKPRQPRASHATDRRKPGHEQAEQHRAKQAGGGKARKSEEEGEGVKEKEDAKEKIILTEI